MENKISYKNKRGINMKQTISLSIVLLMIVIVGCSYIAPISDETEEGVTLIDISELVEKEPMVEEEPIEVVIKEKETEKTIKEIPTLKVTEGETVSFPNLKAIDPDGDKISYLFSEPLDSTGAWETKEGDAGEYTIKITASDGTSKTEQEVRIIVLELNKPPVLEKIQDIVINEGETLRLEPKALDPEGEPITITYTGWMNTNIKELDYNSAGEYVVRVIASDGSKDVFQDVKITVKDVNRAPEFVSIV
jgi:hypothetical protein